MKRAICAVALLAMALPAYAGKKERDYAAKTLAPAVKKAADTYKASCGCDLAITVDEASVKTVDDMSQVRYIAERVEKGAAKYCTDAASKKAVCAMKSLTLAKQAKAAFTFAGGKGTASTDGQAGCTFEMMTRELDK